MLELTDAEKANGWDEESLSAYFKEREKVHAGIVMFDPAYRQRPRPRYANNQYSPLHWRR